MNTDIGHSSPGDYKHHSLSENGFVCVVKTRYIIADENTRDAMEWLIKANDINQS